MRPEITGRRSWPGLLLRMTLGLVIVVWLLARMDLANLRATLLTGASNWYWMVSGIAILFGGLMTCVWRWKLLLGAQGFVLPLRSVFRIFFTGHFFNLFMIGATGGDLVKALLAARLAGGRKTEAVSTVLIDRAIGLTALVMLAGMAVAARAGLFLGDETLRPFGVFIIILAALTMLVIVVLFSRHWPTHPRLAGRGLLPLSAVKIEHFLRRVYEAFYLCRRDYSLLLRTFALSAANHLLAVVACMAFGRGLGLHLGWSDYLTYIPVIGVFGAIPVTPGGLGVREGAAVVMLAVAGVPRPEAMLLALLLYLGMTVWSLFGGLILLLYRLPGAESLSEKAARLGRQELNAAG